MPSYLVIAHQTAQSPYLIKALKDKQDAHPSVEFVLLVPVTRHEDLIKAQEGSPRDIARRAAGAAAGTLMDNGLRLKWTVISEYTPAVALDTELKDHPGVYDEVILSTYPEGTSRWMMDGILASAQSHGLPVTEVVTDSAIIS